MKFVLAVFNERMLGSAMVIEALDSADAELVAVRRLMESREGSEEEGEDLKQVESELRADRGQWWAVFKYVDKV